MNSYVIGLDFGTDSVRALLVNTSNGEEIANSVYKYDMWSKGLFCEPKINQYRQHPSDHFIGLEHTIKEVIFKSKIRLNQMMVNLFKIFPTIAITWIFSIYFIYS